MLIIEVNRLLVTWKTVDNLLMIIWANFLWCAKKVGSLIGSKKIKYYNLFTILNVCRKYQGKRYLLIWNWLKKRTIWKCDLSVQCHLEPVAYKNVSPYGVQWLNMTLCRSKITVKNLYYHWSTTRISQRPTSKIFQHDWLQEDQKRMLQTLFWCVK